MVPTTRCGPRRVARVRVALLLTAALPLTMLVAAGAEAAHVHTAACRDAPVGEYTTDGEVGEYVTGEIPEYVTGEIPEYVTREIPEYEPPSTGEYIGDDYPPGVQGSAYVEVTPGVFLLVRGAHGRAYARYARLIEGLEGDRRTTYEMYGFPPFRHRENEQDIVTEHWSYPERDITFVFCGDTLIGTRSY